MDIIQSQDLLSLNNTLFELNCLRRWSEVVEKRKFAELPKQALNSMVSYVWAIEAVHEGYDIDFTLFPKIAISRSFTKSIQCDIPEHNLAEIFRLGKVSKVTFDEMILEELSKVVSESLFEHLKFDSNSLESKIFRAATKLSTLLELEEIRNSIPSKEYHKKKKHLQTDLSSFSTLPGYTKILLEPYLDIFRDYSQLRNRIRWAKHPNIIKSSVLGHCFDVAVFAYLMSLETNPQDMELASRFFFMGIFHDFPERWTGDMPSPIKDAIQGLREATELFENQVMEENVYSHLPGYQVEAIRQVMLEDEMNTDLKSFLKISDNFAAFIECWREVDSGSHHRYYIDVIEKSYADKENLPKLFRLLMEKLHDDLFYR